MGIDDPDELFAPPQPQQQPIPPPQVQAAIINANVKQAQIAADAQSKERAQQVQLAIAQLRQQPTQQSEPGQPDQPAMDPKLAAAILNAQVRQNELAAASVEKEKDRTNKLMIEKLKLASSLTVHPESEAMVEGLLDTDKIPLYQSED